MVPTNLHADGGEPKGDHLLALPGVAIEYESVHGSHLPSH